MFQDIVLPLNKLEEQIDISDEIFDAYPILVYPCRIYDHGPHRGQLRPPRPDQMCPDTNWGNKSISLIRKLCEDYFIQNSNVFVITTIFTLDFS